MGKGIETVKGKSSEGRKHFEVSRELGQKAVAEAKRLESMGEAIRDLDVGDDVKQAVETVLEGINADAQQYVKTEVKSEVDKGTEIMGESSEIASELVSGNQQVLSTFEKMSSAGKFGEGARASSSETVKRSSNELNQVISDNKNSVQEANRAIEQALNELGGN